VLDGKIASPDQTDEYLQMVVPRCLRQQIIREAHDPVTWGLSEQKVGWHIISTGMK